MKAIAIALLVAGLHASASAPAPQEPPAGLTPAKLHPASGLDMARSPGQRGSERLSPDSSADWKMRFPKQPNGQPR